MAPMFYFNPLMAGHAKLTRTKSLSSSTPSSPHPVVNEFEISSRRAFFRDAVPFVLLRIAFRWRTSLATCTNKNANGRAHHATVRLSHTDLYPNLFNRGALAHADSRSADA